MCGWCSIALRALSATAGGYRAGRSGPTLNRRLLRPQQVSSRGLIPRLLIGTLQLSIRCSSIHFLPKRSFPVSTVDRPVSDALAACDCSCAMAGDSAAITSEAVTPRTCLREEGHTELCLVGG